MRNTLVAASAAAALLAAGIAPTFAQPETKETTATERSDTDRQRGPRFSAEDRRAFTAARIAALKAGLELTAEQETHWGALETALRAQDEERSEQRAEKREQRTEQRGERSRPDALEALTHRADALRDQAERLTQVSQAARPLFESLDDAQKRRFGILLRDSVSDGPRQGPGFGPGHGPHHGR